MRVFGILLTIALLYRAGPTASAGDAQRDFGWQIADDGVLEYIIQISPQQAAQMQANKLENLSALPPALVGRARRIAVRIGTDPLPRTPSLEEIERTIPRYTEPSDVTAALGPGRIAEVEGGQVVDVQNTLPRLPAFGDSNSNPSSSPSSSGGSFNLPSTSGTTFGPSGAAGGNASNAPSSLVPSLPSPAAGSAGSKFLDGASAGSAAPSTSPPSLYQPSGDRYLPDGNTSFGDPHAHRGGIKTVVIPQENAKDLAEIPDNIKNKLNIEPVRWIDEVLKIALERLPQPRPAEPQPATDAAKDEARAH